MDTTQTIWKGAPQYNLRQHFIYSGPGASYVSGKETLSIFISLAIILLLVVTLRLENTFLYIIAGIGLSAIFAHYLFKWNNVRKQEYLLTKDHIVVKTQADQKEIIPIDKISNLYSLNLTKQLETIVVSYVDESNQPSSAMLIQVPRDASLIHKINEAKRA